MTAGMHKRDAVLRGKYFKQWAEIFKLEWVDEEHTFTTADLYQAEFRVVRFLPDELGVIRDHVVCREVLDGLVEARCIDNQGRSFTRNFWVVGNG